MNLLNALFPKPVSAQKQHIAEDSIDADGRVFKVFIYVESRRNCSASIGKKGVHIRLSKYLTKAQKQEEYLKLKEWAQQTILTKKLHELKPQTRKYADGDVFKIQGREFLLRIQHEERAASKGHLKNGVITLTLSKGMKPKEEQRHKSYLVSRLIGNEFQPMVAKRLQHLNELHFKKTIKKVTLRYNQTNWGSCSTDGKISISTGLLFTPPEVMDYILIHELAHLVEHNHSNRFWSIVENILPDYRTAEKWLNENGKFCVF